jgi:hypothetical protein
MSLPSISVINFSSNLDDQAVQDAIRAVNRQVNEDYLPVWGHGRILRFHAPTFDPADEETLAEDPVRGESVLYLVDEGTLEGALGYHSLNASGVPFGFVFTENVDEWTVTLSHEALELITDPTANILVPGPDPRDPENTDKVVLHAYESCDAVERTSYFIDGIRLSNFVTPAYFSIGDEPGTYNDFLGVGVTSFGATQDSHIAFFDLDANDWVTFFGARRAPFVAQAKRAEFYDLPKPSRPDDEILERILVGCKERFKGLGRVTAVSRTARYRDAAMRLGKK